MDLLINFIKNCSLKSVDLLGYFTRDVVPSLTGQKEASSPLQFAIQHSSSVKKWLYSEVLRNLLWVFLQANPVSYHLVMHGIALLIAACSEHLHYCNFHAAIQCPPIRTIPNGVITYTSDNTPNYDLGTVATYACDTGFVLDLSIGSVTRTCVDDLDNDAEGVFNKQGPRCIGNKRLIAACSQHSELNIPMQPFSVPLYRPFPMESSPTLQTTYLTMIWALWPLMPVTLGLFWTSPQDDLR